MRLGRIEEIEGIRGVLSIIVLITHIRPPHTLVNWTGFVMEVFFVISGFFITRILLAGDASLGFHKEYYWRRALRIWPLYYAGLIGTSLIEIAVAPDVQQVTQLNAVGFIRSVFFLQYTEFYSFAHQLPPQDYAFIFTPSWSLALEEQYYMLWPLLLAALLHMPPKLRWVLALLALAGSWWLRAHVYTWMILGCRLDAFVLGIVGAFLERFLRNHPEHWLQGRMRLLLNAALVTGIAGFVGLQIEAPLLGSFVVPAAAVAGAGLVGTVVFFPGTPGMWILRSRVLTYLGQISFSLYIWHMAVIVLIQDYLNRLGILPGYGRYVLTCAVAIAFAHVSHEVIEKPFLKRRIRKSYTRSDEGGVLGPLPTVP